MERMDPSSGTYVLLAARYQSRRLDCVLTKTGVAILSFSFRDTEISNHTDPLVAGHFTPVFGGFLPDTTYSAQIAAIYIIGFLL